LQDGGVRAVVIGRVHEEGARTVIGVDILNPLDGATIAQLTEQAADVSGITASVRRAALALRERIGEPDESIARSRQALQRTPPPPLTAVRSYAQGAATAHSISSTLPPTRLPYQGPEWAVVERLARDAVEADPTFAPAWILLSDALGRRRRGGDNSSAAQMLVADQRAHEEKAVQLIAHATPRERYFIESRLHGGRAYQQMTGGNLDGERRELELSIAATQALLALQPDDDAVSESALQRLNDLLGPQFRREITLMTIQAADARPKNVALNLEVADIHLSQLRPDAARIYVARAESAMVAARPDEAARIRLFPAAIAWLQDDVDETRRIADAMARAADSLGEAERRGVLTRLVGLYFALGRARQAEAILNRVPEADFARVRFLSNIAAEARLRRLVAAWPESVPNAWGVAQMTRIMAFIETGRLDAAAKELVSLDQEARNQGSAGFRSIYLDYQGALELAHGRPDAATRLLRQSIAIKTQRLPGLASIPGHYAISVFARALEANSQLDEAIAILSESGRLRGGAAAQFNIDSWMLHRAVLARLYRKKGQLREAEAIEAHLLKLLALADPDFPLLQELRARSN